MRKRRYETLLPLKYNDGRPVSEDLFEQTREELVTQFGSISVQPNVVRGIWVGERELPGTRGRFNDGTEVGPTMEREAYIRAGKDGETETADVGKAEVEFAIAQSQAFDHKRTHQVAIHQCPTRRQGRGCPNDSSTAHAGAYEPTRQSPGATSANAHGGAGEPTEQLIIVVRLAPQGDAHANT